MFNKSLYDKIIEASDIINQRGRKGAGNYITVPSNIANIISNRFRNSRRKEKIYRIYGME